MSSAISHNVPAVYNAKTRADKMWRRFAVGMSEAIGLGKPEPEPPTGGEE
jgi:hypothetical protein